MFGLFRKSAEAGKAAVLEPSRTDVVPAAVDAVEPAVSSAPQKTERRLMFRTVVELPCEYWAEAPQLVEDAGDAPTSLPYCDGHGTEERPVQGTIRDLSGAGMRFRTARELPIGATVHARLEVPKAFREHHRSKGQEKVDTVFGPRWRAVTADNLGFDALVVVGKVVSEAHAASGFLEYSVRFEGLDPGESDRVGKFCHLWQLENLRARARARVERRRLRTP